MLGTIKEKGDLLMVYTKILMLVSYKFTAMLLTNIEQITKSSNNLSV